MIHDDLKTWLDQYNAAPVTYVEPDPKHEKLKEHVPWKPTKENPEPPF